MRGEKLSGGRRGVFQGEDGAGKAGGFAGLERCVIRMRSIRVEDQDAESMARPAIVTKKALQARFLHAGLFVDAGDSASGGVFRGLAQARGVWPGTTGKGIDEGGPGVGGIVRGDGAAVI